jgi:hypothetical protein
VKGIISREPPILLMKNKKHNMKKCKYFIVIIFFWSCTEQTKPEKLSAYVSINNPSKYIEYKVVNKSPDSVFIPERFFPRINNDSILFEAYEKSDLIHYNQFMIPKVRIIAPDSSINGGFSINYLDSVTINNSNYYFRVFDEDFNTYLQNKKMETYSEKIFLNFEKEHSLIVAALRK